MARAEDRERVIGMFMLGVWVSVTISVHFRLV